MAQITLQSPQALLILPVIWLLLLAFAWRRRFKPFGAFLLRLFIVVLVLLGLSRPVILPEESIALDQGDKVVALVDRSASIPENKQQAFQAEVDRLAHQSPQLAVLHFADQPMLQRSAGMVTVDGNALPLNPELTNLAEALRVGATLIDHQPGRLVLFSDGRPTVGELEPVLAELTRRNIPVDVFLPEDPASPANEIQLVELSAPPTLREGEAFDLEVLLYSDTAGAANLALQQDGELLAESAVTLEAGLNRFTFEAEATQVGLHTFQASLTMVEGNDDRLENNQFSAYTQIYPPPQILVVGDEPRAVSRFATQLEEAGFVVEQIRSEAIPSQLSELEPYAGMALVDVSARTLDLEQMLAVQEFVRSLGRGLLVSGGRNSFSLGGYEDTPLAELLPLSLEPPPREERPPVALLLIIDHSGSMAERQLPATKLAMAKEAAIRATDILGPDDLIGVLIFDNNYEWTVPFRAASDGAELLEIQSQIATIPIGGGTRILQAMEIGLPALAEQETFNGPRHAVLLSDGKSFDGEQGREDYDLLVDQALQAGITLSTIAIGTDADQELLAHLAERGLGRYHFAAVPDELPALTIAESDILRSSALQEGEAYRPAVFAPHPVLRGLVAAPFDCPNPPCSPQETELPLPNLSGYIAMTPKPRSEIALQLGPGDPLLAVWGYGLGRVAAWSSDTGHEWAMAWNDWPDAPRFWGQVLGYTLPSPDLGLLQLETGLAPDGVATLTAEGVTATGQTVDLAATQAVLTTPGGRDVPLTLRQVAPGRYQQTLRLPDPGVYRLSVTQARRDEPDEMATIGFVLPYPAEYSLVEAGAGVDLLRHIAELTGGRTFTLSAAGCDPQLENCPDQTSEEANLALQQPLELWPWLLTTALMLWPVEIAWRRWSRLRIQ